MGLCELLTIAPGDIMSSLQSDETIKDFSNYPILTSEAINVIKRYFLNNVGYNNEPIVALSRHRKSSQDTSINYSDYIPTNSKSSLLLLIKIDSDLIVSIKHETLLSIVENLKELSNTDDPEVTEELLEFLYTSLLVGGPPDDDDYISFLPFIRKKDCEMYAILSEDFSAGSLLAGTTNYSDLKELVSFTN